jgi:histidine ammonia-lyase
MVTISHTAQLSIDEVMAVVRGAKVRLAPATRALLKARRAQIVQVLKRKREPAYGFNRGFGHNVDLAVPPNELAELQKNFMRSHSCGVGQPACQEVVRATMLLRAQSLARGHSAVRPQIVEQLLAFLNHGITPVVPSFGSVGASGDLAPLSHIGLALIGEGECFVRGSAKPQRTAQVLKRRRLKPLVLEMKEGLALSNGVQYSTAYGIIACAALRDMLKAEALATALTAQVMLGSDAPFKRELHELRPHRGSQVVAQWIWSAMQDSPIRDCHRDYSIDGDIQDPYNLRCAAQVLGACYDLIEDAAETLSIEANSATDNPLLLDAGNDSFTEIVSGGHFHGMPVAVKLYSLVQAAAIMASLINARCARYVDGARNKGLGSDLAWPDLTKAQRAVSSSMMIPEYVSAALTNALWGLSAPSHLMSISTNSGQEDHVSMSAGLGVRLLDMLPRLAELIGIELAYASQAAAIRRHTRWIPSKHHPKAPRDVNRAVAKLEALVKRKAEAKRLRPRVEIHLGVEVPASSMRLSPVGERLLKRLWKAFPPVTKDRVFSPQLAELARLVYSGELVREAERALPLRHSQRKNGTGRAA